MATKRISRQEVHEDPVAQSYHRAQEFVTNSWRWVLTGAIVIVALVVLLVSVQGNKEKAERSAQGFWLRAQSELLEDRYPQALGFAEDVIAEYPNTPSGKRALLIKAECLAAMGNLDQARVAYDEALTAAGSDVLMVTSARRGLAAVLEDQGDNRGAAELYDRLATESMPEGGRIFDLHAAARAYANAGDRAAAITKHEELVSRYENETDRVSRDYVHLAKVTIAELSFSTN